jgi:outer membrane protein
MQFQFPWSRKMKAIKWMGVAALAAVAGIAQADEGNWMVRARALHMNPDNGNSGGLNLPIDVKAENKTFPEIDITYFFTPNIAAELILTYPQKHDVDLGGTGIGSVKHLPPTLTLQYHFNPTGTIRPYAGLGLNYTRFSSVNLDAGPVLGGSVPLKIDRSSVGFAAQVGADFQIAPQVVPERRCEVRDHRHRHLRQGQWCQGDQAGHRSAADRRRYRLPLLS